MPENYITFPDGTKVVVFSTDRHPDFQGQNINIQEVLQADIPTYVASADNVAPALNKNILTVFNNLPTKRIRVQEVYVYPKSLANHIITLQLGYINAAPTGGSAGDLTRLAADFDAPPAAPNTVLVGTGGTASPVAGVLFGGNTFSVNTAGTYVIFEKSRNGSAIQLRPQPNAEGLILRQTSGAGTTGTLCAHMVFTLD